jgi:plastocyanin
MLEVLKHVAFAMVHRVTLHQGWPAVPDQAVQRWSAGLTGRVPFRARCNMPRIIPNLPFAAAVLVVAGACKDSSGSTSSIRLRDDCDPATFNAGIGAGTCQHSSSAGVTLSAFNAELQSTGKVAAWQITPATLTVNEGDVLPVVNTGGETHTYTEVEEFGGGVVPALNQASGNPVEAPECANKAEVDSSTVHSGQTMMHTFDDQGTVKYQCCIHPWMRQTVTVR